MSVQLQLLELLGRTVDQQDRLILLAAYEALTPKSERLKQRVSAYCGDVALVADVVAELGLRQSDSVLVGRTLAGMGYKRVTVCLFATVFNVWVRNGVHPLLKMHQILERRSMKPYPNFPEKVREHFEKIHRLLSADLSLPPVGGGVNFGDRVYLDRVPSHSEIKIP